MVRLDERPAVDASPHAPLFPMGIERRTGVPGPHLRGRIPEHAAHEPGTNLRVRTIAIVALQGHKAEIAAPRVPLTVGERAVVRAVRLHRRDAAREHLGGKRIVRVGKKDILATRGVKAGVARGAHAPVRLHDNADAGILRGGGREDRSRVVRRAVVHEDCLEVAKCLLPHTGDARGERVRRVPARDDKRGRHLIQSSGFGAPLRQVKDRGVGEQYAQVGIRRIR